MQFFFNLFRAQWPHFLKGFLEDFSQSFNKVLFSQWPGLYPPPLPPPLLMALATKKKDLFFGFPKRSANTHQNRSTQRPSTKLLSLATQIPFKNNFQFQQISYQTLKVNIEIYISSIAKIQIFPCFSISPYSSHCFLKSIFFIRSLYSLFGGIFAPA